MTNFNYPTYFFTISFFTTNVDKDFLGFWSYILHQTAHKDALEWTPIHLVASVLIQASDESIFSVRWKTLGYLLQHCKVHLLEMIQKNYPELLIPYAKSPLQLDPGEVKRHQQCFLTGLAMANKNYRLAMFFINISNLFFQRTGIIPGVIDGVRHIPSNIFENDSVFLYS
jgi:hypothetical protein